MVDYNEYINEDGEKKTLPIGKGSELNMVKKTHSIHCFELLLMFMLCLPIKVHSYSLLSSYDASKTKYAYQVIMNDEEVIKVGPSVLTREVRVHSSQLTKLFETGIWSLEHKEEYFCQQYKCEALSVCGMDFLPFIEVGDYAQILFKFTHPDRAYYTCQNQKQIALCTFGSGCKLISFQINYDEGDMYEVFSISKGGSHGGSITPPVGCVVESVKDESSGMIDEHLFLYHKTKGNYFCPKEALSLKPELGMLGDFQLLGDGSIRFASNEISCVANNNGRAICRYQHSTITNVEHLCISESKLPFSIHVDRDGHRLSWKMSGQATVGIKCDRPLDLIRELAQCTDIKMSVWEVTHLDSPLILSFTANSVGGKSTFTIPEIANVKSHPRRHC